MNIRFAFRHLRRSLAEPEGRVVLAALVVAVASLTTVGFFSDRVARALERQAGELIGGDLALIADKPIPPETSDKARQAGLTVAQTTTFPSMALGPGDKSHLVELRAVSDAYPLRGKVRLAKAQSELGTAAEKEVASPPQRGTAWIAPAITGKLDLQPGGVIRLGNATFTVTHLIAREPDSVLDYFGLAPRVLIHENDLAATALVQPGSRVTYRMVVAGEEKAIAMLQADLKQNLARGQRVEAPRDARGEVRVSLERAGRFLSLAAMFSVVLAAAAVALAMRRYSERQLDAAAIMRCLGAGSKTILGSYLLQMLTLGVVSSAAGALLGFILQYGFAYLLSGFFTVDLPPPHWLPLWQGMIAGLILIVAFAMPPLLRLADVPTLRVIRRDLGSPPLSATSLLLLGIAGLALLIVWYAKEWKLGLTATAGFVAIMALGFGVSSLLTWLASHIRGRSRGTLRYALANLRRRKALTQLQTTALGLGLMSLLAITLVRMDLIAKWQGRVPTEAPNRFAINIQSDQLPAVRDFFASQQLSNPDLYPMVRGRLVTINDKTVVPSEFANDRAKRLSEREFNLTWSINPRADNPIVAGKWWAPDDKTPQFSVEEGIAKALGLNLGDTLAWDVAGSRFGGKITSLRKVDWDSFKPNFFVVASPGVLEGYPASYITSFKLPAGREAAIDKLIAQFPNVSVVDLSAIMEQVRRISEQVSRAVEFVLWFALAAGVVVLYAAITATQDERKFEAAIMRTIGARRRQVLNVQVAEFALIGLLAGALAVIGAIGLGAALSQQLLEQSYTPNWMLPLIGLGGGLIGVAFAGWLGVRGAVETPPIQTIRETG